MDGVWMEILCTALTVTYATNPYTVLLLPKGNCQLCCPYHRDDIKLYLNVPGGPEEEYFDWENGTDWTKLDNGRMIVFYIHGFTEQHTGPAATEIRKAYRQRGEDNLIVVDWSPLAAAPWYNGAVANTPHAADFLAGVIDSLVIRGLPLERFHIIGFSLGAEIAGLLAKRVTVGKLRRVTGLDPALPLYNPLKPSGRLAKTDGEFVDVIHTDGGIFGFDTPMGHADFFPNGGRPAQPGCRAEILVHAGKLKDFVACSHNRAWKYFAESVKDPLAFPAFRCHSFHDFQKGKCGKDGPQAYMGYLADPSLRGKFFLETKDIKPYGLGFHDDSAYIEASQEEQKPQQAESGVTYPGNTFNFGFHHPLGYTENGPLHFRTDQHTAVADLSGPGSPSLDVHQIAVISHGVPIVDHRGVPLVVSHDPSAVSPNNAPAVVSHGVPHVDSRGVPIVVSHGVPHADRASIEADFSSSLPTNLDVASSHGLDAAERQYYDTLPVSFYLPELDYYDPEAGSPGYLGTDLMELGGQGEFQHHVPEIQRTSRPLRMRLQRATLRRKSASAHRKSRSGTTFKLYW